MAAPPKRHDPRQDALGPEAGLFAKRQAARAAASKGPTALIRSRALASGELYNERGEPIVPAPPATPAPHATAAPRRLPVWGWVALAVAVGAGAWVVLGDDDRDDDEDDEAVAA